MNKSTILHISDIQFGRLCAAQPERQDDPSSIVDHPLFQSFFDEVRTLWDSPDVIVASGDITSTGSPYEFLQARAFLQSLSKNWGDETKVIWVPGNHDVSWDISRIGRPDHKHYSPIRFAPYYFFTSSCREAGLRLLSDDLLGSNTAGLLLSTMLDSSNQIVMVGLNSALDDDYDALPHAGYIHDQQAEKVKSLLSNPKLDGWLKVVVLHHHVVSMKDPPPHKDFSEARNAQVLFDAIDCARVDLVLHGHRHYPYYVPWTSRSGWLCHLFCAGSLATVDTERNGFAPLQAHLLTAIDRDSSGSVYGKVESIEGKGSDRFWKWRTGGEHSGVVRFGRVCPPAKVAGEVLSAIGTSPERLVGKMVLRNKALWAIGEDVLIGEVSRHLEGIGYVLVDTKEDIERWRAFRR